ncbi:MAG: VanZ family protein [Lachnospiraceae bacterium]|nr:VanZ family protein [Lachnospiraceae bacterium]
MMLKQHNQRQRGRSLLTLLFWIYIAVLLRITVFRESFSFDHLMENGNVNPELFTAYIPFLRGGFIGLFIYLFVGNIVWFIPLGGYLVWKHPKCSVLLATIIGFLLSLGIETSQYVFGVGVTELDDLVLNTAGTLIGAVFVRVVQRMSEKQLSR